MSNIKTMIVNSSLLLLSSILVCNCNGYSEKIKESSLTVEAKQSTHIVEIRQMEFQPAELNVRKGDKVIFENHDLVTHDITEEGNKSWSSSELAPGKSWSLTVTKNASYFCSLHPVMKGRLNVE
jgi:plastocyanin